jgi:hypothetical protein
MILRQTMDLIEVTWSTGRVVTDGGMPAGVFPQRPANCEGL